MSDNSKMLAAVWEEEEELTETHLKDVNDQLGKANYEENKDVAASEIWIQNLLEQRYNLVVRKHILFIH